MSTWPYVVIDRHANTFDVELEYVNAEFSQTMRKCRLICRFNRWTTDWLDGSQPPTGSSLVVIYETWPKLIGID